MKIVVFTNNVISPIENLLGLVTIVKSSEEQIDFICVHPKKNSFISFDDDFFSICTFVSSESSWTIFRHILSADIVIGMPWIYFPLRILSRFRFLNFLSLYIGPGKVTKAIGYYKHPERGHLNQLKMFIKFIILNNYYLANDEHDRLYLAAAFGYPLGRIIISKLPKYFYINKKLSRYSTDDRNVGILFAPTHRWSNKIPPLTEILSNPQKLKKLKLDKISIFHSKHPETKSMLLDSSISDFNDQWSDIDILVTDYSSIGEDFLNSGGKHIIYFIPDRTNFEENQGKGILFDTILSKGHVCFTELELFDKLNELIKENIHYDSRERFSEPNYFSRIIKKKQ